ncbi:hypothetical protein THIX_20394 [Thiomonas sp. X19]|nr:hypothetical protein THIX_20394 [Thiomonas sp. X19]
MAKLCNETMVAGYLDFMQGVIQSGIGKLKPDYPPRVAPGRRRRGVGGALQPAARGRTLGCRHAGDHHRRREQALTSPTRLLPTTSVDQLAATLASWMGVADSEMPLVVPQVGDHTTRNPGLLA